MRWLFFKGETESTREESILSLLAGTGKRKEREESENGKKERRGEKEERKKEKKEVTIRPERNLYSVIRPGVVVLATRQKTYRGA